MDKNKLGIVAIIVGIVLLGVSLFRETRIVVEVNQPAQTGLGATSRVAGTVSNFTSTYNNFTGQIEVDGASLLTGTTTVTQSVDGLVIGGSNTSIATTSRVVLYENSTGPKHCDSSVGYARIVATDFAPSFIFSLGTTTDGGGPKLNLIASTTVATTSVSINTTYQLTETAFDLADGEELVAMFGDYMTSGASSTYYGDIKSEFGVWCQDSAI